MQQINSLKKSLTNISIFSKHISDNIFEDMRFVQLMNLLIKEDNVYRYTYCFYCDSSMIKTNIFIPVFHTIYLGCRVNNVLIKNEDDIWLTNIFKHNNYYVLNSSKDTFDYAKHGVTRIDNIKDIEGVL